MNVKVNACLEPMLIRELVVIEICRASDHNLAALVFTT